MCLVDAQLYRCKSGECSKSTGSLSQTQQFSASVDLKWDQHAGWSSSSSVWVEPLCCGWKSWAAVGYLAEEDTDWVKSQIHFEMDWFSTSANTTLEDVSALLLSAGSLRLLITELKWTMRFTRDDKYSSGCIFILSRCFLLHKSTNDSTEVFFSREKMLYILHQVSREGLDSWTCQLLFFKGLCLFLTWSAREGGKSQ